MDNQTRLDAKEKLLNSALSNWRAEKMGGDASFRSYERITVDHGSYILMDSPPQEGDSMQRFIKVTEYLRGIGLSAPKIYEQDVEHGYLLLEDLGDTSFNKALKEAPQRESELYTHAVDVLLHIAEQPLPQSLPSFDSMFFTHISRFSEWYYPHIHGAPMPSPALATFNNLWQGYKLIMLAEGGVSLYDYHADNLMWLEAREGVNKVGLLDYQDAYIASPYIDLVALLQDIRRDVSPEVQQAMQLHYRSALGLEEEEFSALYATWGAHWNMRILGTFVRLSKHLGKTQYERFLPTVLKRVQQNLTHPALQELHEWFTQHFPDQA